MKNSIKHRIAQLFTETYVFQIFCLMFIMVFLNSLIQEVNFENCEFGEI